MKKILCIMTFGFALLSMFFTSAYADINNSDDGQITNSNSYYSKQNSVSPTKNNASQKAINSQRFSVQRKSRDTHRKLVNRRFPNKVNTSKKSTSNGKMSPKDSNDI